jgi:rhodanese-related sulfurtransferase
MNGVAKTPSHVHLAKKEVGTPSPNYFQLAVNSNSDHFSSGAAQHNRGNWSPPTSNVRSTAAASPQMIPVEQNPEFEQFRRQTEANKGFALGSFNFTPSAAPPKAGAGDSYFGTTTSSAKPPMSPLTAGAPPVPTIEKQETATTKEDGHPPKPRSPKRMHSTESALFPERPRRNSPASFEGFGRTDAIAQFAEERNPRPSLPPKKSQHISLATHRAETLPAHVVDETKCEGPTMVTAQYVVNILESSAEEILLLDLRVSTQYAKARIAGALTLCIPTTLLKRASFNVQKLAETFKEDESREKFERWRSCKHIIVYDASSSQMKDAATCINTLKKFTTEGWSGGTYIIRGGFQEFAQRFPAWIGHQAQGSPMTAATASLQLGSDLPSVAPVIGGCPMPVTQNAANPFFGNIRQNMDLIGGVGQMPVKQPEGMSQSVEDEFPTWLQKAAEDQDHGKTVAERFLHIEKREQKRMQEALSGKVIYGTPTGLGGSKHIQIAGIEKGSKNRYNNIWPYEHSRVKIQGVDQGSCDYVNANHVQAAYSNKRYIATQGPIPATFKVSIYCGT